MKKTKFLSKRKIVDMDEKYFLESVTGDKIIDKLDIVL